MTTGEDLGWETPRPGLRLAQPKRGFRYGAEAYWLAGLALACRPRRALDVGTGCGVVAWLLASHGVEADGIDVEPGWEPYWRASLADPSAPARVRLRCVDAAAWREGGYDVVTANPPYFLASEGPVPSDPLRRQARVLGVSTLAAFGGCIARALAPEGVAFVSVPPSRRAALEAACAPLRAVRWWAPSQDRHVVALARQGPVVGLQPCDAEVVAGWYEAARSPSGG
jgi:tRNA1(Val) A37 N6-methylase TrmN6